MAIFRKKADDLSAQPALPAEWIPRHIGIIMDGNGRWATRQGLPRTAGHAAGSETFRTIATYCRDIGMDYLTVYAFSTENWKRPEEEIGAIMSLLKKYLYEAVEKMEKDRIRLAFLGDLSQLSPELQELAADTVRRSKAYQGFQANICLNYGGRDDILRAARNFAGQCKNGVASPEDLDEERFSELLYSAGIPDPELIIRPGGEQRISNFLLWQSAYTEFYFTDVLWPDFTPEDLDRAILAFRRRDRRFGGV